MDLEVFTVARPSKDVAYRGAVRSAEMLAVHEAPPLGGQRVEDREQDEGLLLSVRTRADLPLGDALPVRSPQMVGTREFEKRSKMSLAMKTVMRGRGSISSCEIAE